MLRWTGPAIVMALTLAGCGDDGGPAVAIDAPSVDVDAPPPPPIDAPPIDAPPLPSPATRVVDVVPGPRGSSPSLLTAVGGRLYFVASDGAGVRHLWRSDGTAAGTIDVAALPETVLFLLALGDRVLLATFDGTDVDLWASDGTAAGTGAIRRLSSGPPGRGTFGLVAGGRAYVQGGPSVWVSDGTAAGTIALADFAGATPGRSIAPLGDRVIFSDGACGLWTTDGTRAGTTRTATLAACAAAFASGATTGPAYFVNAEGGDLARTDGTDPGTYRVFTPIIDGPTSFVNDDTQAWFGIGYQELWHSDGTLAGTARTGALPNNPPPFVQTLRWQLARLGREVVAAGQGLYVSRGPSTDPRLLVDERMRPPVALADVVLVTEQDDDGATIMEVSGEPATARSLQRFTVPTGGEYVPPGEYTLVGDTVFFIAADPASGIELWSMPRSAL